MVAALQNVSRTISYLLRLVLIEFRTAASTVLRITYGYNAQTNETDRPDVLVKLIDQVMLNFTKAALPGAWLVDLVPALRHIPDNFPGAAFKKHARNWRETIETAAIIPYHFVRERMASEKYDPSYVSRLVEQLTAEGDKLSHEDEQAIIWTATTLYGAAADTTVISLTAFTLAMVQFPHVQRKAQEELDRVVGKGKLPTMADRDNLPYIDALIKEVSRWWPTAGMGFPHTATEDITYEGYFIPKDAVIMPAVWAFTRDEELHPNPEVFDPERYLSPRDEPDPRAETFGYGRRGCPGKYFAHTNLFVTIAQILAVFDILRPLDKEGKEVEVVARRLPGLLTYASDFEVRFEPRSEKHTEMLSSIERELPVDKSDAWLLGDTQINHLLDR